MRILILLLLCSLFLNCTGISISEQEKQQAFNELTNLNANLSNLVYNIDRLNESLNEIQALKDEITKLNENIAKLVEIYDKLMSNKFKKD